MFIFRRKKLQVSLGFLAGALLIGVVGFVAANLSATTAVAENSKSLKIGVLNLQTVMEKYERSRAFRMKWESRAEEMAQSFLAAEKQIAEDTRELKATLRTTERYAQLFRKIELTRRQLEFDKEFLGDQHLASGERAQGEIFAEIEAAVKNYAAKEGFSVILMAQELPEKLRERVELHSYFQTVMCYDKSVDISDMIVKQLNAATGTQTPPDNEKKK